jgi:ribosome maturation factor RimP
VSDALQVLVGEEVEGLGFELFELRKRGTNNRPTLDVRIDRPDGSAITVEDCAKVSRAIEARLDGSGLVSDRYVLEVSSPGLERPLRRSKDWQRFVGKRVSILSPQHGGRFEAENNGLESENGTEVVRLRMDGGAERRIPLAEIKEARLTFTW